MAQAVHETVVDDDVLVSKAIQADVIDMSGVLLDVITRDGLCAQTDPEEFFPKGKGGSIYAARKVCEHCDVELECREYGIQHPDLLGVWGGLSQRQRRRQWRARRQEK